MNHHMNNRTNNNTSKQNMKHQKRILGSRPSQRGLTLIEVMVAITISLFLLGGVIQVFSSNKQVYRVQDASARIQESGRFALHFLIRDIRMADFWGCLGSFPDVNNHLNNNTDNPFDLSSGGITGTDNAGLNGSDTLNLFGGTSDGIGINSHNVNAASFSLTTTDHGLEDFDYILATDCENADLLEVTNANDTTETVVGNTGAVTEGPGNGTSPGFEYSSAGGARLYKFEGTTYFLATGTSGEPSLFRTINDGTPVELVESVENMQIEYGEDTDDDGAANRYLAAGAGGLVLSQAVSIRITLTVRSVEDNVSINQDANTGDYRLRRTFTSTTTIRNRVS
jgi:type IV pilus assembly protein PilW